MSSTPTYTEAEIESAVKAITERDDLSEAERLIAQAAPSLQSILQRALEATEWFGSAHHAQLKSAAGEDSLDDRVEALQHLLAEEARLTMMVGVAVGFELAAELRKTEK